VPFRFRVAGCSDIAVHAKTNLDDIDNAFLDRLQCARDVDRSS
jgi:hypothetical protein